MYRRIQTLPLSSKETCFLWGPRQTGKSTLLKTLFPAARYYDLLKSDVYRLLVSDPSRIRQELAAAAITGENQGDPIVIDEVQKIPELIDEIHWLIENLGLRFVLCGSSPRKLKRSHANLLGGRAVRYELLPLTFREIDDFSLEKAVNHGLLPKIYMSANAARLLQSYIGDYLKEEIAAEAVTRNIPAFNRFLEVAAICNGEMINFNNIAADCGVSQPTIRNYFQILEDTLIGFFIPAFRKQIKRRLILAPRFFFFDLGLVAHLTRQGAIPAGSPVFGKFFEHFIIQEVVAHCKYSETYYPIAYWRTASQFEVDLILGDGDMAIEIKATESVQNRHMKGLRAWREEHNKPCILVCREPVPRKTDDGILILPWRDFLARLWEEGIV